MMLSAEELTVLKRMVGPAVHSLHAARKTKRRIREELLAHLVAIYHEERSRSESVHAALTLARQRFGDPAAIAAEIQPTISRWSRIDAWLEQLSWQPGDSMPVFLLRAFLSAFSVWFATLLMLSPVLLIGSNRPLAGFAVVVISATAIFASACAAGIVLLSDRIGRGLFARRFGVASRPCGKIQTVICLLLSGALFPALAYLLAWKTSLGSELAFRHTLQALWLVPVAPLLLTVVGYKMVREEQEERAWTASEAS
jgi:hypothetical protein